MQNYNGKINFIDDWDNYGAGSDKVRTMIATKHSLDKDKRFRDIIGYILKEEGGYVNNDKDPGGETNFGVSKRRFPNLDIKKSNRRRCD